MSHRKEQVESLIKRTLAEVLQRDLADPRIQGMISITEVDCSPDLRNASVYVSILPQKFESRTIHGLRDATRHIQNGLKKRVALRMVPHLQFKLDPTLKKQAEVFAAIEEGLKRTAQTSPQTPDPSTDPSTDQDTPSPDPQPDDPA